MTTEQQEFSLQDIQELLRGDDVKAAVEALATLHPADQAELYDRLEEDDIETMVSLLSAEGLAHLLEHLDEDDQHNIVMKMPRAALGRVLDQTDNDIAVDV